MRFLLACLLSVPGIATADVFVLPSKPDAVTVYAFTAEVTRRITIDLPQGAHEIVLPDLPPWLDPDMMKFSLDGGRVVSSTFRASALPPQPPSDSPAISAAKAEVERAERAIRDLDDAIEAANLGAQAAEARISFLADLGDNEGITQDSDKLRAVSQMIGDETLRAAQDALAARQAARDLNDGRKDLDEALKQARAALAALTPRSEENTQLTLSVEALEKTSAQITLRYLTWDAQWWPVYDIFLTRGDTPKLDIARGALIRQTTGEIWQDVTLKLSTLMPTSQTAPSRVWPNVRKIIDKPEPAAKADYESLAEPMIESPVIIEDEQEAAVDFEGVGVRYSPDSPVTVASRADKLRIALGTLSFEAREFARAVPRLDETAFLMAAFKNTTQEPLLPSEAASVYVDNRLVGRSDMQLVPAGGDAEIAFGPIEDLRLKHVVLNENAGDEGVLRRSNTSRLARRMEIQNLGQGTWEVEVIDRVPVSAQEDLEIVWQAQPTPNVENRDDERGILSWSFALPAGETQNIDLKEALTWPEDKVLR